MSDAITEVLNAVKGTVALTPQLPIDDNGEPFIVLNDSCGGQSIESLQYLQSTPQDTAGEAHLDDLDSFIHYVNDRKQPNSRVFATLRTAVFEAILDFHDGPNNPRWCRDKAVFSAKKRSEWDEWINKNNRPIPQAAFAEFVEDNMASIVEPAGAQILEIAKNLTAKKTVHFKSGVNLDNGDVQLLFEETTESKAGAKGTIQIPSEIVLGIAPFEGAPPYKITARLRYRIDDGKLSFTYRLHQPERCWEDAVKDAIVRVGAETELPVALGSYERK